MACTSKLPRAMFVCGAVVFIVFIVNIVIGLTIWSTQSSFLIIKATSLIQRDGDSTSGRGCSNMKCLLDGSTDRAIVTLAKTAYDSHTHGRLKHMLASIQHFYTSKYTVIIFTEMDFSATQQAAIKNCTDLNIVFVKIDLFEYVSNGVTLSQAKRWEAGKDGGIVGRRIGYRLMCKFWAFDVFRHPVVQHLTYIMRMDDDSYFPTKMKEDPFDVMEKENLDYGYRAWFCDNSLMYNLWNLTEAFLVKKRRSVDMNDYGLITDGKYGGKAIYDNFFIAKPEIWRRSHLKSYLQHLVDNHAFLKYKIGDGNVHAFILALAVRKTKTRHFRFAYNHNCHIHSEGSEGFAFNCDYLKWLKMLKCRHITIATTKIQKFIYDYNHSGKNVVDS